MARRGTILKSAILMIMALGIFACGDDAFNKGGNPSDTETNIKNYSIAANAGVNNANQPVVDASENASASNRGVFTVSWSVVTSELYTYQVYLSADENLDPKNLAGDVQMYAGRCGGIGATCSGVGDISCTLSSQSKISCGSGTESQVGGILVASPSTAYVFLLVRNEALNSEDLASQAVEFRF